MDADLFLCMTSCHNPNNSGILIGNDSYDLECISQCLQRQTTSFHHTVEKYIIDYKSY
jgi:hypothetical protein